MPKEIKNKHGDIPWKEIADFRDRLIHFYFGIKYELVWNTIKMGLPKLKSKLEKILKKRTMKKLQFYSFVYCYHTTLFLKTLRIGRLISEGNNVR
ncbi:MAG: DUF86 domain-containing protein [Candidatus Odinarchaeota archaeon]|nr:DUF86 domain-containing protein [Candidatus Odinarchaeota archaeon]